MTTEKVVGGRIPYANQKIDPRIDLIVFPGDYVIVDPKGMTALVCTNSDFHQNYRLLDTFERITRDIAEPSTAVEMFGRLVEAQSSWKMFQPHDVPMLKDQIETGFLQVIRASTPWEKVQAVANVAGWAAQLLKLDHLQKVEILKKSRVERPLDEISC